MNEKNKDIEYWLKQKEIDDNKYSIHDIQKYLTNNNLSWDEYKSLIVFSNKKHNSFQFDELLINKLEEELLKLDRIDAAHQDILTDIYKNYFQLLFKYNKVRQAQRDLIYFQNIFEFKLPHWVWNFSAKALFKMDIDSVFLNPEKFFEMLLFSDKGNIEIDNQKLSIIRELLHLVPDNVTKRLLEQYKYNFIIIVDKYVNYFKDQLLETWQDALKKLLKKVDILTSDQQKEDNILYNLSLQRLDELLNKKNEEIDQLKQLNELNNEQIGTTDSAFENIKIIILGDSLIDEKIIYGIAKTFELEKDQLDLVTDYEQGKRFNIDELKYNSKYDGILIGPIAHKIIGTGAYSSAIQRLSQEEGFPPLEEIRTNSGELKITKSSLKSSLDKLLNTIRSNIYS